MYSNGICKRPDPIAASAPIAHMVTASLAHSPKAPINAEKPILRPVLTLIKSVFSEEAGCFEFGLTT